MRARWVCLIVGLAAIGCGPVPVDAPSAARPWVYGIHQSDGSQCIAIDRGGQDVDLVCDFAPLPVADSAV